MRRQLRDEVFRRDVDVCLRLFLLGCADRVVSFLCALDLVVVSHSHYFLSLLHLKDIMPESKQTFVDLNDYSFD